MAPFRASLKYKITSMIGYLGLALCGVFSVLFPPSSFVNTASLVLALVWGVMLSTGGLLGAWGVLKRKKVYEAVGLPILASALAAFGFIILSRAVTAQSSSVRSSVIVGALLFAFAGMLIARSIELGFDRVSRRTDGRRGR